MTIHLVDEIYDNGKIIFQAKVNLDSFDTPDDIASKVLALEHKHYSKVIEDWVLGNKQG
jgi:phosphoribosylglycinamide formyltransferase-1